jgi:hypothetical protein
MISYNDIILFNMISQMIDNIKRLAGCVNNKEVYLTVLKTHARAGHLSYLRTLEADLADAATAEDDASEEEDHGTCLSLVISYTTSHSLYDIIL